MKFKLYCIMPTSVVNTNSKENLSQWGTRHETTGQVWIQVIDDEAFQNFIWTWKRSTSENVSSAEQEAVLKNISGPCWSHNQHRVYRPAHVGPCVPLWHQARASILHHSPKAHVQTTVITTTNISHNATDIVVVVVVGGLWHTANKWSPTWYRNVARM